MKMRKRINLTISHEAFIKYHYIKNKLCVNVSELISKTLENIQIVEKEDGIYVVTSITVMRVGDQCLRKRENN